MLNCKQLLDLVPVVHILYASETRQHSLSDCTVQGLVLFVLDLGTLPVSGSDLGAAEDSGCAVCAGRLQDTQTGGKVSTAWS